MSSFAGDIKLIDLETGCSPKKCAFMFGLSFIPCIVIPARLCYLRKNPRIEIDREYSVPGTLCQKCRNGKIKHGFIIDGQCVREVKDLYICIQCKIVYPEYNLSKYIGNKSPYNPYKRRHSHD